MAYPSDKFDRYNQLYLKRKNEEDYKNLENSDSKKAKVWDSPLSQSDKANTLLKLRNVTSKAKVYVSENVECLKCKSKFVNYTIKQIRRADEPQTIFFNCQTCDHKWRIG